MVDKVEFPSETPAEDPAKAAEMVARGEALANGESPPKAESQDSNADRPAWLPEKFKTPEDMAAAYAELEKKQGQQNSGDEPKEKSDTSQDDPLKDGLAVSEKEAGDAEKAAEKAGVSMAELRKEYSETGALSDETYEALQKAGFEKTDVDAYIEGQKAIATRVRDAGFGYVGGEENYTAMAQWMQANSSVADRQAYNAALQSEATREMAIRGMFAKYTAAVGQEPGRNVNGSNTNTTVQGYASRQQMVDAMADPKYAKDPAYREEVAKKLAASPF